MSAPTTAVFSHRANQRRYMDAVSLQDQGKHRAAAALLRENAAASIQHLGPRHLTTLNDQDTLSDCLHELGEYREAVRLDRETLRIRKSLSEKTQTTLATQHSLASNLSQLGEYEESVKLNRSTLALRESVLGKYHDDTLETRHQLAYDLHKKGQDEEASQLNLQTLRTRERTLALDDYDLIASRHNLAINFRALQKLDKALALCEQNLVPLRKSRPEADQQLREVEDLQKRVKVDMQKSKPLAKDVLEKDVEKAKLQQQEQEQKIRQKEKTEKNKAEKEITQTVKAKPQENQETIKRAEKANSPKFLQSGAEVQSQATSKAHEERSRSRPSVVEVHSENRSLDTGSAPKNTEVPSKIGPSTSNLEQRPRGPFNEVINPSKGEDTRSKTSPHIPTSRDLTGHSSHDQVAKGKYHSGLGFS